MAQVIFVFEGNNISIQCLKEDIMENICKSFASKIGLDINSLYFMYNGTQINMELKFEQQANFLDKETNIMKVLVDKIQQDEIRCPKCGEKINFNKELLDDLTSSNNNINNVIIGIQFQINNILNNKILQTNINMLNIQLKNINILLGNAISEVKNIKNQIKKLFNFNKNIQNIKLENESQIKMPEYTQTNPINNIIIANSHQDKSINKKDEFLSQEIQNQLSYKYQELKEQNNDDIEQLFSTDEGRIIFRNGLCRGIIHKYNEIDDVVSKIQNILLKGVKFNLVYKAIEMGDKASTFHEKCDGLNMSLVLIETTNDIRFGGFTTKSWEGNCIRKWDKNAFVFNLENNSIFDVIEGEPAIGCYPKYGPVFFGCQIRIYDVFFYYGGTTCLKGLNYKTKKDYELNNGKRTYLVKDIEVYSIEAIDI